jgi:hypothetical protein
VCNVNRQYLYIVSGKALEGIVGEAGGAAVEGFV